MAEAAAHRARRELIRRLLRTAVVATQDELGELLRRHGVAVTQATLSRDLARLRARRVTLPDGGTAYEVDGPAADGDAGLALVHRLVTTVEDGDALVVVRTLPGAASAVAAALDASRRKDVLGTIAGDDTIFVAPRRGVRPARLRRELALLWKKGLHA